jgi:hypothetical protein
MIRDRCLRSLRKRSAGKMGIPGQGVRGSEVKPKSVPGWGAESSEQLSVFGFRLLLARFVGALVNLERRLKLAPGFYCALRSFERGPRKQSD